jgi:C4-dicarboxylate transporter DctQ subunit
MAFTVIAFAQVMVRFLGGSIPWSEEAVRYLFLWLCFHGFSVAMNRGGHILVDFFINFLPRRAKRALALASDAVIVGFLVFLFVKGARIAQATE